MMLHRKSAEKLCCQLQELERKGIQLDRARLKENICSQFPDHRLWIREYIVNAFDAEARTCWISGTQAAETLAVTVSDDGGGMNREGVEAFLTKFRSLKQRGENAVGRFGIGSFSAAAIPGQCGFAMVTSTGQETWHMTTGGLLDDRPLVVERITPVLPRGTAFTVTFERGDTTIDTELQRLRHLARKYVYHLPINVQFRMSAEPAGAAWIPGNWVEDPDETFSHRYCFNLECGQREYAFDVVLGVGFNREQLYQNRVLVAENREDHDLLGQDLGGHTVHVAHLSVRVESPHFELPFGRHCLRNPEVLGPLARHIRERLLPQYMGELIRLYEAGTLSEFLLRPSDIEDMASTWMASSPDGVPAAASVAAVFRTHDGKRLSYAALRQSVENHHPLYLEAVESSGLDYTVFEGPVLSLDQPRAGLEWLQAQFKEQLINLSLTDLIQEAPAQSRRELTPHERRFGGLLGFSQDVLEHFEKWREDGGETDHDLCVRLISNLSSRTLKNVAEQAESARHALGGIEWTVGYLVGRDGRTPCQGALFLCKGPRVVLNLHHPDIAKLVRLAATAPDLAGHFATAMCLSAQGQHTLLAHLSETDRDLLIQLDAILRCGRSAPLALDPAAPSQPPQPGNGRMNFQDFLRHVSQSDFRF